MQINDSGLKPLLLPRATGSPRGSDIISVRKNISIVTVLSGHQRTIGNQGIILNLRIFAVILNLILDLVAVKLGYGVKGVAWATIFIDTILAIYLLENNNAIL